MNEEADMKKGAGVYIGFFAGSMIVLACGAFATLYRRYDIAILCLAAFGVLIAFYVRYRMTKMRTK